jgi:hypothetical protein
MRNWFESKKIIVPIDFGEHSHEALDAALNMVFRPSDIHVIHVAPDLAAIGRMAGNYGRSTTRQRRGQLQKGIC